MKKTYKIEVDCANCAKLVELDAMKNLKNSFISEGAYTKGPKKVKRRGRPKKVVNA